MRIFRHPCTLNNEFPIKLSVDGCEAVVPSLICRQHSRQQRDGGYGIAECALPQPPKREHALHVAWLISLEAVDVPSQGLQGLQGRFPCNADSMFLSLIFFALREKLPLHAPQPLQTGRLVRGELSLMCSDMTDLRRDRRGGNGSDEAQ